MMPAIADYMFKNDSNFLYSTGGAPKHHGARTNPPYSPSLWAWCVNNVLINALKKIKAVC